MDDLGFPRTPDRPIKLLGTCVRYLRSVETSIGARGPNFLGGSATVPGRLVPVGFDCASRRGAVSRGSAHSRSEKWVRVGSGVWSGLSVREMG